MLTDKIKEITRVLTHLTEVGVLVWTEESPNSQTRNWKRKMSAIGEDNTHYDIEIKFILHGEDWILEDSPSLWVRNKSLPDGMMLFSDYKSDGQVSKLRNAILMNCCSDMSPSIKDVEDTLDGIAKGISIVEFREGRLNKILNQDEK